MHQQHGIKLFVVDYLQLLHSTARRAENRQQEIADISGGLKALAKELDVPVIVLAQLNRELEKRAAGRQARLSDLRESGSLERMRLVGRSTGKSAAKTRRWWRGTRRRSCELIDANNATARRAM